MSSSRITTDLVFDRPGKQVSFLRVPHSSNTSAYGWIGVPIAVIKGGAGPTVLMMAGNHGDEYEGQVTLARLIRNLEPADVAGRLIIIPAANVAAARAGARVSPIDDGNLNRTFPGNRDGGPTAMIAHYLESELLPQVDYAIDMHSGGKTLEYIPSCLIRPETDPAKLAPLLELLRAFNAPIGFLTGQGDDRTLLAAAARAGVPAMGTELGGGGALTPFSLSVAEQGARNFLAHLGVLRRSEPAPKPRLRLMTVADPSYYLYAPSEGLFAPAFALGDTVEAGQLAGLVQSVIEPLRPPVPVHFAASGVVICKRTPAECLIGDCLAHLATDYAA